MHPLLCCAFLHIFFLLGLKTIWWIDYTSLSHRWETEVWQRNWEWPAHGHSVNGLRARTKPCTFDSQTCALLLASHCWWRYSDWPVASRGHTGEPKGLLKSTHILFPVSCGEYPLSATIVPIFTKCLYLYSSAATLRIQKKKKQTKTKKKPKTNRPQIIQLLLKPFSCVTIASIKLVNDDLGTITSALFSSVSYLT